MEEPQLESVSDFFKLALFSLHRIVPTKTEYNGRFAAYFPKDAAQKLLADYEAGRLQVDPRDYADAIERVKNQIFERERTARATNGGRYEPIKR